MRKPATACGGFSGNGAEILIKSGAVGKLPRAYSSSGLFVPFKTPEVMAFLISCFS